MKAEDLFFYIITELFCKIIVLTLKIGEISFGAYFTVWSTDLDSLSLLYVVKLFLNEEKVRQIQWTTL